MTKVLFTKPNHDFFYDANLIDYADFTGKDTFGYRLYIVQPHYNTDKYITVHEKYVNTDLEILQNNVGKQLIFSKKEKE